MGTTEKVAIIKRTRSTASAGWPKVVEELGDFEFFDVHTPMSKPDHPMIFKNILGLKLATPVDSLSTVYACGHCNKVYEKPGQVRAHIGFEHTDGPKKAAATREAKRTAKEGNVLVEPKQDNVLVETETGTVELELAAPVPVVEDPFIDEGLEADVASVLAMVKMVSDSRNAWKRKALAAEHSTANAQDVQEWRERALTAEAELAQAKDKLAKFAKMLED